LIPRSLLRGSSLRYIFSGIVAFGYIFLKGMQYRRVPSIAGLFLIIYFLTGIMTNILTVDEKKSTYKTFVPYWNDYVRIKNPKPVGIPSSFSLGKLLVINMNKRYIDDIHMKLPNEMRALSPEEVENIVWIKYAKEEYNSSKPFPEDIGKGLIVGQIIRERLYQFICDITVIDKAKSVVVAQERFVNEPVVRSIFNGKLSISEIQRDMRPIIYNTGWPEHKILEYLKGKYYEGRH